MLRCCARAACPRRALRCLIAAICHEDAAIAAAIADYDISILLTLTPDAAITIAAFFFFFRAAAIAATPYDAAFSRDMPRASAAIVTAMRYATDFSRGAPLRRRRHC